MSNSETEKPRFVLELDMLTEKFQTDILNTRFEVARKILNRTKYILEQNLKTMKSDENYQFWISQPKSNERTKVLNDIRESYDLSKNTTDLDSHRGLFYIL